MQKIECNTEEEDPNLLKQQSWCFTLYICAVGTITSAGLQDHGKSTKKYPMSMKNHLRRRLTICVLLYLIYRVPVSLYNEVNTLAGIYIWISQCVQGSSCFEGSIFIQLNKCVQLIKANTGTLSLFLPSHIWDRQNRSPSWQLVLLILKGMYWMDMISLFYICILIKPVVAKKYVYLLTIQKIVSIR